VRAILPRNRPGAGLNAGTPVEQEFAHAPTIAWVTALALPLVAWLVFWLAPPQRVAAAYREQFADPYRERLFLAMVSFLVTFAAIRGITRAIHAGVGPFGNVVVGGTHIHHLVWGILLLLGVGYAWLVQAGVGVPPASRLASTLTSVLFGAGSALTLDEFALWFNLADVYWAREGRESFDAVALFGSALAAGLLGSRFFAVLVARRARAKRRGDTPPPQ
jgi:hypothetical protein